MDEAMAVVMHRDSVAELNHLLDLMDQAAADPKGSPITMDLLFGSGFTQHGLGGAHAALRDALVGGDPTNGTPRPTAPRPPVADPPPARPRPVTDPDGYEDISEEEKQTALLEEVVDVLETVKMVLIAVAVVAMLAVVVAAVALAT